MSKKQLARLFAIATRILAIFLGGFALINLASAWISPDFDATIWWVDLRFIPLVFSKILLAIAALGWLHFGFGRSMTKQARALVIAATSVLMLAVIQNICSFYWLVLK